MDNAPENREHTSLFVYFLRPAPFDALLIGGIMFTIFNMYTAFLTNSAPDILGAALVAIVFVPAAIFFRNEAHTLLVKRVDEIFSEDRGKAKDLFSDNKNFSAFAKKSKETVHSKREYYFIIAFLVFLAVAHPTTSAIIQGRANGIIQNALTFGSMLQLYFAIYWGILVGIIAASIIYSVVGFIAVMFSLNREKDAFKISKSIGEVKTALALLKAKGKAEIDFDFVDLSFGELKETLTPFQRLGYDLAIGCATIGLAYATPGIAYFLITHDLSNTVYYGLIVFVAVLSITVFMATEIGIRRVWGNSKSEALLVLEQLCDRVKLRCVKSICKLESYQAREDSAKDVAFVRSTISDLKDIKTSDLTSRTVAQIATTVVLPYIPLILKVLGLY